jgi:hypothetical protein
MPARRVTTVTVPVDVRSGVAVEAYQARTPLLTIRASAVTTNVHRVTRL